MASKREASMSPAMCLERCARTGAAEEGYCSDMGQWRNAARGNWLGSEPMVRDMQAAQVKQQECSRWNSAASLQTLGS